MIFLIEASLVFTILAAGSVWFYWVALFPCLVLKSRFKIQEIVDNIHLSARDGTLRSESHGFIELQHFLDLAKRMARHAEMIASFPTRKTEKHELEDLKRRIDAIMNDDPMIRDAFFSVHRWMFAILLASRPMRLLGFGIFLDALAIFSDWAVRIIEQQKNEVYTLASRLPA
jgi:hypothetical protein